MVPVSCSEVLKELELCLKARWVNTGWKLMMRGPDENGRVYVELRGD